MKTKLCPICLISAIGIALTLSIGCEKEVTRDNEKVISYGTLTDIDGNLYATIKFGQQEWMAENLRVTRYNDGMDIPTRLSAAEWFGTTEGAYSIFPLKYGDGPESDAEVVEAYGLHYNWYAVESGNLCPAGWRVPELTDWEALLWHLIDNYDHIDGGNVGASLKSCRQANSPLGGECNTSEHPHWLADGFDYFDLEMKYRFPGCGDISPRYEHKLYPLAGNDQFGFSALPAGVYVPEFHYGLGYISKFWADAKTVQDIPVTTESGEKIFITVETVANHDINFGPGLHAFTTIGKGLPVRCLRGESLPREPSFREP